MPDSERLIPDSFTPNKETLRTEEIQRKIETILSTKSHEEFFRFPYEIIQLFAKEKIPEKTLLRYSLEIISVEDGSGIYDPSIEKEIHLGGHVNITLNYEERKIATIGIQKDENGLLIFNQIQCAIDDGEHGENFRTAAFNWRKVLVTLGEEYLKREFQRNEFYILPAKRNNWATIHEQQNPGQRGYKIYDETALLMGYTYNQETELYEKNLSLSKQKV